jgi:hypothetical protein
VGGPQRRTQRRPERDRDDADAAVPHWTDRLRGADVYTLANAYQLAESLRIDYGHLGPFGIHP